MTSGEKLKKLMVQTFFKQFKILNENLVTVERVKVELTLNQPIYVGLAILDLLRTLMYDFHFNYIKRKYPDSTLLFTDTDSFPYQIQTGNMYADFYADNHFFNFPGMRKKFCSLLVQKNK